MAAVAQMVVQHLCRLTVAGSTPAGGSNRVSLYQPWMDDVQIGDVLATPSGRLRVVRSVSRYKDGPKKGWLKAVHFTIKHCSWTHRCTTVLNYTDLACRGFQPTGKRVRLRSKIDKLIALDCAEHKSPLDCCDVRNIA